MSHARLALNNIIDFIQSKNFPIFGKLRYVVQNVGLKQRVIFAIHVSAQFLSPTALLRA